MTFDIERTGLQRIPPLAEKVEEELTVLNVKTLLSNACESEVARTAFESNRTYIAALQVNPKLANLTVAYAMNQCAEPGKHLQAQKLLSNLYNELEEVLSADIKESSQKILKKEFNNPARLIKLAREIFSSIKLDKLALEAAENSQILAQRNFEDKHGKLNTIVKYLKDGEQANLSRQKLLSIRIRKNDLIEKSRRLPLFVFTEKNMTQNKEREQVKEELLSLSREEELLLAELKEGGFYTPNTESELQQVIKRDQEKTEIEINRCKAEIGIALSKLKIATDINAVIKLLNFPPKITAKKPNVIFDKINKALLIINKVDPSSEHFKDLCKKLYDTFHEVSRKLPSYHLKEAEKIILESYKNLDGSAKNEINNRIKAAKSGRVSGFIKKKVVKPTKKALKGFRKFIAKIMSKGQKSLRKTTERSAKKAEEENKPMKKTIVVQHRIQRT